MLLVVMDLRRLWWIGTGVYIQRECFWLPCVHELIGGGVLGLELAQICVDYTERQAMAFG